MVESFIHEIQENSSFFQGHIEQFFSKKGLSFQILNNYDDRNKLEEFNVAKYKPLFIKKINRYVASRNTDGGKLSPVNSDELIIYAIKLIDNIEREDDCGKFRIFPRAALCTKDNCHQYFEIDEGRKCGHKEDDPWEQVTFLAFCDDCGRLLPLHYMTNLLKDCENCGEKSGLSRLWWGKKDEPGTYKVGCKKCNHQKGLFFYECNHDYGNLSSLQKKKFRGVPARAGTILHPYVTSIPDIPQEEEIDASGKRNQQGKLLSEAFREFFPANLEESLIYLPEFREAILNESSFWDLSKIEDLCDELNLDLSDRQSWTSNQFLRLTRTILKEAKTKIYERADQNKIKNKYGIDKINKVLDLVKNVDFDENDLQGIFLLTPTITDQIGTLVPKKRFFPNSPPNDFEDLLNKFGLKEVIHIANFNMVQALLGIIEGSTRREPLLFRPVMTGKQNNKKPTVYVRNFLTEGIIFQLDYEKILKWIDANKSRIDSNISILTDDRRPEYQYTDLILHSKNCEEAIATLLHTYSHMLIQQSTIDTGLDVQSLSEKIYPKTASIFIYSTNNINIGGLEFTYDYHLRDWLKRMDDLASDCPQDPACMIDEGGACNACSYVPEFVCERFNQELDRSSLVGGSSRFSKGYLK